LCTASHQLGDIGNKNVENIMKIKTGRLLLTMGLGLLAVIGINGCTSGPLSSNLSHSPTNDNSTFSGDNHTQPVYTSPTITPVRRRAPRPDAG
jgi:hypothetical protein